MLAIGFLMSYCERDIFTDNCSQNVYFTRKFSVPTQARCDKPHVYQFLNIFFGLKHASDEPSKVTLSALLSLLTSAPGMCSLPESMYVPTQARSFKPMFSISLSIFFHLKHASPNIFFYKFHMAFTSRPPKIP